MLVYRVETADGRGAYSCGAKFNTISTATSPMPGSDPTLGWYDDDWCRRDWEELRFAFDSMQSFRRWFTNEDIAALAELCMLSVYEANTVRMGTYQCVFDRAEAEILQRIDLKEAFFAEVD